jgi:hypothetical protein
MQQSKGKWTSIMAMGIAISPIPAAAQNEFGAFSDRQGASQMTIDLVIPFGNAAKNRAQNAPRLQLEMAYYPWSESTGSEYDIIRQRVKQTSTIGFTLDGNSAWMLNGKPLAAPGRKAALNTIETVGVVIGGLALVVGGLVLYGDSVIDNEDN